jgi:hypothetical protein
MSAEADKDIILDEIKAHLEREDQEEAKRLLATLHPSDIRLI